MATATEATTVEVAVSTTVEVDSVASSASFFAFSAAEETNKIKVMEVMLPRQSLLNPMMSNNHNQWDMEDNKLLFKSIIMEVNHNQDLDNNHQWDTVANHNNNMDNNHQWDMEDHHHQDNTHKDNTQLQLLTTIDQIIYLR